MSRHVCAHISGMPAWFLTWVLRKDQNLLKALDRHDLSPYHRQDIEDAFRDLAAAAEHWRTSANGNAETPEPEIVAPSDADELLTTTEAAEVLDLSPRRVRQLGPIIGRKVNGRWQFNRSDLEIHQGKG